MSLTNATPLDIAQSAREGSRTLAVLKTEQRNAALTAIHKALAEGKDDVLAANATDLEAANKAAAGGTLSASLVKRLDLGKPDPSRVCGKGSTWASITRSSPFR